MRSFWRWLLICIPMLLLFAGASVFGLFKLVERHLAAHLQPPILKTPLQSPSDLSYSALDNHPEHLSSLKGKVVFVNLWGTWCVQCVAEMPTIQKLYEHYRNDPDVVFIIASRLDSASRVRAYAQRHHFELPFYLINDDQIPSSMQLNQYPATFLFAKDGMLTAQHEGAADWAKPEVTRYIDQLKRK
jgi:thiol-disulfide isomerase/thioredoxin